MRPSLALFRFKSDKSPLGLLDSPLGQEFSFRNSSEHNLRPICVHFMRPILDCRSSLGDVDNIDRLHREQEAMGFVVNGLAELASQALTPQQCKVVEDLRDEAVRLRQRIFNAKLEFGKPGS